MHSRDDEIHEKRLLEGPGLVDADAERVSDAIVRGGRHDYFCRLVFLRAENAFRKALSVFVSALREWFPEIRPDDFRGVGMSVSVVSALAPVVAAIVHVQDERSSPFRRFRRGRQELYSFFGSLFFKTRGHRVVFASRHAPVHRVRNFGVGDKNFAVLVKDGVVRQRSRQDAKKETQAKHVDFQYYKNDVSCYI